MVAVVRGERVAKRGHWIGSYLLNATDTRNMNQQWWHVWCIGVAREVRGSFFFCFVYTYNGLCYTHNPLCGCVNQLSMQKWDVTKNNFSLSFFAYQHRNVFLLGLTLILKLSTIFFHNQMDGDFTFFFFSLSFSFFQQQINSTKYT